VCDRTHSYASDDSFSCVICLIHMHDMTHSYVRDMTHSYVCDMTHFHA